MNHYLSNSYIIIITLIDKLLFYLDISLIIINCNTSLFKRCLKIFTKIVFFKFVVAHFCYMPFSKIFTLLFSPSIKLNKLCLSYFLDFIYINYFLFVLLNFIFNKDLIYIYNIRVLKNIYYIQICNLYFNYFALCADLLLSARLLWLKLCSSCLSCFHPISEYALIGCHLFDLGFVWVVHSLALSFMRNLSRHFLGTVLSANPGCLEPSGNSDGQAYFILCNG